MRRRNSPTQIHCASTDSRPYAARARRGTDALGHFLLEHQRQPLPRGRLAQPADQQRRGDVVRQVGDDLPRRRHQRRRGRAPARRPPPRAAAGRSAASSCIAATARGSTSTAVTSAASLASKRAGQPARPRPDLDHVPPGQVAGLPGDARGQVGVEQEMLAERAARIQPVPRDDLAQRRQRRLRPTPHPAGQERWSRIARRCRSRINCRDTSSTRSFEDAARLSPARRAGRDSSRSRANRPSARGCRPRPPAAG